MNLSFKNKFPYMSVINEASDFKFGKPLQGFAEAHHKIIPRGKSGHGPGLGELSKIWGCPLIYSPRLKIATSKLAGWWGLSRPIIPPRRKRGRGSGSVLGELPNIWGFSFNIYAMAESIDFKFGTQFGWTIRPIITSYK